MNAPPPLKVFITGASSGLGLALAAEYARHGATLGLVARRADALAEFAQRFPKAAISIYPADVRDADALALAASRFVAAHGCPDVVIANAGISKGAITGEGDLAAFREIMDVNYYGMIATFEPFIAPMTAARRGTLVGIASVAGVRGLPGSGAYSASKAAAIKYLEALRVELRAAQVAVVTIAPGYIRTPMTEHNPYPMPFLMDADRFAKRAALAISQKTAFRVIPWQMGVVAKLLHVMPRWLYDRLFEKAPRKPRAKAG
ncbi:MULTISPECIES: SDR family oxidoreductase [Burkholderia]|uniref:SDR family oxidoreductase n=2 Tax=Burkholderia humptydooensis TaxID=430531 RepID=A0A7U4STM2_9BURK|nr:MULTISPECIES: SDR family oxidoreductase [Burkholderia]AGK47725.1 short chain dehydrogenase family protein [Burkholderia thailandensis MSMB121]ATF35027.1 short-chain dehydrogenase [Burkholderia thailandensis]AJY41524.1 short chain dehydrogenase family protein [Burkholderia sp. 2002721687]ALX43906.1 short-chain dehydrogenase [Burkholderia humptydooensis]EIP89738.1 short chain dehydrogenase [Burkholderia humptydooensis MSMB43]